MNNNDQTTMTPNQVGGTAPVMPGSAINANMSDAAGTMPTAATTASTMVPAEPATMPGPADTGTQPMGGVGGGAPVEPVAGGMTPVADATDGVAPVMPADDTNQAA